MCKILEDVKFYINVKNFYFMIFKVDFAEIQTLSDEQSIF